MSKQGDAEWRLEELSTGPSWAAPTIAALRTNQLGARRDLVTCDIDLLETWEDDSSGTERAAASLLVDKVATSKAQRAETDKAISNFDPESRVATENASRKRPKDVIPDPTHRSALRGTTSVNPIGRARPKSSIGRRLINMKLLAAFSTLAMIIGSAAFIQDSAFAAPSTNETQDQGLWYLNKTGLAKAHAEGLSGKGIRIAVVDDGINSRAAELQGANIKVHGGFCLDQASGTPIPADSTDPVISQHGTSVVAMLVGNGRSSDGGPGAQGVAPDAQIDFFAAGPVTSKQEVSEGKSKVCPTEKNSDGEFSGDSWESAMNAAAASGADFVSVSLAGQYLTFKAGMIDAMKRGVTLVGSALNPGDDSVGVGAFPAAGNGTLAVNAVGNDAKVIGASEGFRQEIPIGRPNMGISAPGAGILSIGADWKPSIENGTSLATPYVTGVLALAAQKYPKASKNQLIQALIHTTDDNSHGGNLDWDELFGYGILSLPDFLGTDPSGYPDVNPLFVTTPSDPRCKAEDETSQPSSMEQCAWAKFPTAADISGAPTQPNTSTASTSDNTKGDGIHFESVYVFAVVAVVVLGGAVWILTFSRMRRRSQPNYFKRTD